MLNFRLRSSEVEVRLAVVVVVVVVVVSLRPKGAAFGQASWTRLAMAFGDGTKATGVPILCWC